MKTENKRQKSADKTITWESRSVPLSSLKAWSKNPRKASGKQYHDLEESLERYSQADPIIINTDGTIIGGHFRHRVLVDKGVGTVDVRVPSRPLTETEIAELNLRLNKNTGSFDQDLLAGFDEELLLDVGFEPKELDDIFDLELGKQDPDHMPDPPAEAKSKVGDLYQLGDHRLLCGDSTKREHLQALLGGTQVKMVFTDPPYNVNYSGKGENTRSGIKNDHLAEEDFQAFISAVFGNMHEIMADGAVYYICSGWSSYPVFHSTLQGHGFYRAGVIIWEKDNASYGWSDYRYKHEWILVGKKRKKKQNAVGILYGWKEGTHLFRDTRDEYDIWHVPRRGSGQYKHPTEKPVWLIEKALANSSERYDNVLDLFGGSGSTLIACERLHRKAFLMELDERYVDVIVKRWEDFTGGKAVKIEGVGHGK